MDYNKTTLFSFFVSGASAGTRRALVFPQNFMIKKVWARVYVAGAAATHVVRISNFALTTDFIELPIGTAAAGTLLELSVPEASRAFQGNVPLLVRNVNNSASSSYELFILCAHQE
jgi:hypothetical protein